MTVIAIPEGRASQLLHTRTFLFPDHMQWLSSPVTMGYTCHTLLPKRGPGILSVY